MTAAVVFGQEFNQSIDTGHGRPVTQEATFLHRSDQTGLRQSLEMKRQRRRRQSKLLADHSRRQAFGGVTHQQAEDGQTAFLGQGSKRADSIIGFHVSNNMET